MGVGSQGLGGRKQHLLNRQSQVHCGLTSLKLLTTVTVVHCLWCTCVRCNCCRRQPDVQKSLFQPCVTEYTLISKGRFTRASFAPVCQARCCVTKLSVHSTSDVSRH